MHLNRQQSLGGHRLQVPVDRVDHDHSRTLALDRIAQIADRAVLVARLVAIDADAHGVPSIRIETPYADFTDRQIADLIADMELRAHTARLGYYDAASRMLAGEDFKRYAAIAKLNASNAAMENSRYATQVHGGYGYVSDYLVEKIWRDVRVCQIYEGTSDVQRILIGRGLAGL